MALQPQREGFFTGIVEDYIGGRELEDFSRKHFYLLRY